MALDALLLRTADRNLRRQFSGNIPGLTDFANKLATEAQDPVTITSSMFEGGQGTGIITMAREIWLTAAEELLADPRFNPAAAPQPGRVILPDYRFSSPS